MPNWSEDIVEVECPDCGHPHLIPVQAVRLPISCERCGTLFQVFRELVRSRPQPRSDYLATLRSGGGRGPPREGLWNATMTIVGLAVLAALLVLYSSMFGRS